MAQFPLALAIEPRLLPCAVANGFLLDYKVLRMFVTLSWISNLRIHLVSRLRFPQDV